MPEILYYYTGVKWEPITGGKVPKGDIISRREIKIITEDVLKKISKADIIEHEKKYDHELIHDPHILGTKEIKEETIGKGKFIMFDGEKLVYAMPPKQKTDTRPLASGVDLGMKARYRLKTITGDYTLQSGDEIVHVDASGGSITITIHTAVGYKGVHHFVKRIDNTLGNDVTFATTGSETIDFETLYRLVNRGSGCELYSDGVNWFLKHS